MRGVGTDSTVLCLHGSMDGRNSRQDNKFSLALFTLLYCYSLLKALKVWLCYS